MNLQTVKKALSESHLVAGCTFDIFKDVEPRYMIDRAIEELKHLKIEYGNIGNAAERATKVIQLMAMFKVKIFENKDGTV